MSNIIKEFNNEDAKLFTSILNDINQISKTLKKDTIYTIKNGKVFAYKMSQKDYVHVKLNCTSLTKNKMKFFDDIKLINGYINGKEFFDFYKVKDIKDNIIKVILYDDKVRIETNAPSIYFESDSFSHDYKSLKKFLNKIKSYDVKLCYQNNSFEEILNDIDLDNLINPYTLELNIEKINKPLKFRIVKKMFPSFKKESKITLRIYSLSDEVFLVNYSIINKNFKLDNYCTIVNY